ncbi:MAG: type II toxin-antitoxin system RelE/ParE family toxin [Desulfobacteraceae bacterium]|jgi:putative addiction module killer protein
MISIQTTDIFDAWFASLKDKRAVARIQARIDRAEDGNFGDCSPVGEGVSEMRIHYGPGYRVYFVQRGVELVILLAGQQLYTEQGYQDRAKTGGQIVGGRHDIKITQMG